ncbi:Calcium channel YVC1 [Psilocybe cubensis]|uniref:YVC1 N-terminal linker helical domain-containing protein n=2 Tax=Psilocybe cubensis TaxID=181762 RepID=A0A8H7XWS2_PSICU|nr:Calcium channel YVC1 [Psilocybe cubensis]KAH9482548.1 Calcium channel YVC1 [Psilocybe cubensis]
MNGTPSDAEDVRSLLSVTSVNPTPDTLTKLVKRLRALTLTLLPVEADIESISEPTSRIITPQVISAYKAAAGDFTEALPYCLLRARAEFIWDANHNPADYGENRGRAIACEVLARRIVHLAEPSRVKDIMAKRYQHRQIDGDESEMSSALEMAIDQHCTIFLSSSEAQEVVNALWTGDLIQKNNENHDIDYVVYADTREHSFWGHFDPSRLSVPRYQNIFRITVWLFFLVVYSRAVREPLERLNDAHRVLDGWELVLYVMALSFTVEDLHKLYILLRFVTWRAFSFWNAVAFVTDTLLISAFILRVISLIAEGEKESVMRLRSFQSNLFNRMKLVTIFDGYKYIGTMQICVARMLKESGIFFALLSVLAVGFAQGLYALDAADGSTEPPSTHYFSAPNPRFLKTKRLTLISRAPDYGKFAASPTGLMLYYLWNAVTAIILLNVLISLFSSAYSDVIEDAEAQYLAFFASKTVGMIRAPDSYVYPAPFNLIEAFLVAPLEFLPFIRLKEKTYAKLNRYVMGFIFILPLTLIAFVESTFDRRKHTWMENWFRGNDEGSEDLPENRDPVVDDPNCQGLEISKIPFEELIKVFPNTVQSTEATILKEIGTVKQQLQELSQKIDRLQQS